MPRVRSPEKFETIVEAAGRVFAQVGYRRAMMSDIAEEAGVALGTLYGYAETKEELFELALRVGLGEPAVPVWEASRRGFEESVYELARTRFRYEDRLPTLADAVERPSPGDASRELFAIAAELYDVLARLHVPIRMLDRSSPHWPELASVLADELRAPVVRALTRYLESRCGAGALREPPDVRAAARLVVETLATHAMHRHFSPGGPWADDATARRVALDAVTSVFHALRAGPAGPISGGRA